VTYIKYSLDFLQPITTSEMFEAVNWLADLPQRTWPQASGRSSDVILKSLARDVIYTSRAYATMSLSVCLWRNCIGTL